MPVSIEPPSIFTPDPETNRASARRLADLRPRVACFGHGPVLRDPGRIEAFVASFPEVPAAGPSRAKPDPRR